MPQYRIRVEKIDVVPDVEPKWLRGGSRAKSHEHCEYEYPPEGAMKKEVTDIYDQTVDALDMSKLVQVVNGLL